MTTTTTTTTAIERWGPWRLNPTDYTLELELEPHSYYVDLEECVSSAEVLDRIAQVNTKRWADSATLAGLVRALDDILHLQGTLCGSGISRRTTSKRIRAQVDARQVTARMRDTV